MKGLESARISVHSQGCPVERVFFPRDLDFSQLFPAITLRISRALLLFPVIHDLQRVMRCPIAMDSYDLLLRPQDQDCPFLEVNHRGCEPFSL